MPISRVSFLLSVALAIGSAACGINDRDLPTAANAYYSKSSSAGQAYKLLAKPARQQWSESDFSEFFRDRLHPEQVKVLGEETQGSNTYAKVVLVYLDATSNCRTRETRTWIQEDGRWRVLAFSNLAAKASKQYQSGDYAAALETTEEWLKLDPFSVDALSRYIFAQQRSGSVATRGTRSDADVIRSMLAINPEDDTVLFNAASHSEAVGVAKGFLNKMSLDSCYRENAVFNILHKLSTPKDRLAFLDEVKLTSASLSAARVEILNDLGRGAEAMTFLKEQGRAVNAHLRTSGDPAWSAGWAVRMGTVAVQNGDDAEARRWLETAAALDPQSDALTKLDRRLNDSCCNKLAARLGAPRVVGTRYGGSYVYVTLENLSPVPFKRYEAKAEVLSSEGFPIADTIDYGNLVVAPGQTRELKFIFFAVRKANIADVRVELTSISVDGLNGADPSFWVRKVPPVTAEATAKAP